MIKDCMLKVTPCALEETVVIEPGFEIRPYYAGHVLGAAMFYVKVGQQSFVYTGDYNMTPDRYGWIQPPKKDCLSTRVTVL